MPQTLTKASPELEKRVMERLEEIPGSDHMKMCIQCGTCAGSCPVVKEMEYSPREMIGLVRAGYLEEALRSNSQWQCVSCYLCTVRCPAQIKITEMLYALKNLSIKENMVSKDAQNPYQMMKKFNDVLRSFGRSWEMWFLISYYTWGIWNPFALVGMTPFALNLFIKGRLPYWPPSHGGAEDLRKILSYAEKSEVKE